MYFDAVIDEFLNPVFNGTTDETVEWLEKHKEVTDLQVCDGRTLRVLSAPEYLKRNQL